MRLSTIVRAAHQRGPGASRRSPPTTSKGAEPMGDLRTTTIAEPARPLRGVQGEPGPLAARRARSSPPGSDSRAAPLPAVSLMVTRWTAGRPASSMVLEIRVPPRPGPDKPDSGGGCRDYLRRQGIDTIRRDRRTA